MDHICSMVLFLVKEGIKDDNHENDQTILIVFYANDYDHT